MKKIIFLTLILILFLISGCAEKPEDKEIIDDSIGVNDTIIPNSEIEEKVDWLGEPKCSPDNIFTFKETDVCFDIFVNKRPDELVSESPVKLFKKDKNDNWILLGELIDDNSLMTRGSDRIYSNTFSFYEENETVIPLKIIVITSDNRQYPVEFNLSVYTNNIEEIILQTNEVSNLSTKKLKEIMQDPPSDMITVAQILGDYLVKETYVESYEILGNNAYPILDLTLESGVIMEIYLTNLDEGEPPGG
jgi:hypothetical protein